VIEARDMEKSIYELPLALREERLDRLVCDLLSLETPTPDLREWEAFVQRVVSPAHRVNIVVVGKYVGLRDAYKSIYEALTHAGAAHNCGVTVEPVDAADIEAHGPERYLSGADGILIPGGFGDRGVEGKILAARYARETRTPYLGLCLGMQIATIEFARDVCGLEGANSTEFDPGSPHPVICLLEEQKEVTNKGASMRLGTWDTLLQDGTRAREIYGRERIAERHRHRYEFNPEYKETLEDRGFVVSGTSPDGTLAEIIELPDHPFFVAVQFHPEFQSKPNAPHPLFSAFVRAALEGSRLIVD
jgi:CTP synthase